MAPDRRDPAPAWEAGAAEAPLDRAPSLLHSLGAVPRERARRRADRRPVRRAAVRAAPGVVRGDARGGRHVPGMRHRGRDEPWRWPSCSRRSTGGPGGAADGAGGRYTLLCRIPLQRRPAGAGRRGEEATLRDLLERCVLEASSPDGPPVAPRELPEPPWRRSSRRWPKPTRRPDGAERALPLRQRMGRRAGHPPRGLERPDRLGRPDADRGPPARAGLRLVGGRDPGDERVAAALVPGGRGMVTPYLSRLRPARIRAAAASAPAFAFRAARALPIDGPAIAHPGLSCPARVGRRGRRRGDRARGAPRRSLVSPAAAVLAGSARRAGPVPPARAAGRPAGLRDAEPASPRRDRSAAAPPHRTRSGRSRLTVSEHAARAWTSSGRSPAARRRRCRAAASTRRRPRAQAAPCTASRCTRAPDQAPRPAHRAGRPDGPVQSPRRRSLPRRSARDRRRAAPGPHGAGRRSARMPGRSRPRIGCRADQRSGQPMRRVAGDAAARADRATPGSGAVRRPTRPGRRTGPGDGAAAARG